MRRFDFGWPLRRLGLAPGAKPAKARSTGQRRIGLDSRFLGKAAAAEDDSLGIPVRRVGERLEYAYPGAILAANRD
jgi:hypothetical protein